MTRIVAASSPTAIGEADEPGGDDGRPALRQGDPQQAAPPAGAVGRGRVEHHLRNAGQCRPQDQRGQRQGAQRLHEPRGEVGIVQPGEGCERRIGRTIQQANDADAEQRAGNRQAECKQASKAITLSAVGRTGRISSRPTSRMLQASGSAITSAAVAAAAPILADSHSSPRNSPRRCRDALDDFHGRPGSDAAGVGGRDLDAGFVEQVAKRHAGDQQHARATAESRRASASS